MDRNCIVPICSDDPIITVSLKMCGESWLQNLVFFFLLNNYIFLITFHRWGISYVLMEFQSNLCLQVYNEDCMLSQWWQWSSRSHMVEILGPFLPGKIRYNSYKWLHSSHSLPKLAEACLGRQNSCNCNICSLFCHLWTALMVNICLLENS